MARFLDFADDWLSHASLGSLMQQIEPVQDIIMALLLPRRLKIVLNFLEQVIDLLEVVLVLLAHILGAVFGGAIHARQDSATFHDRLGRTAVCARLQPAGKVDSLLGLFEHLRLL